MVDEDEGRLQEDGGQGNGLVVPAHLSMFTIVSDKPDDRGDVDKVF